MRHKWEVSLEYVAGRKPDLEERARAIIARHGLLPIPSMIAAIIDIITELEAQ
jgi:hypothetical protein